MGGITGSPAAFFTAIGILVVMLPIPLLHNGYYENLARTILMFVTMSLGWNLIGGYTGYVSFGNVVFFGLGTYCSAILAAHGIDNVFLAVVAAMAVSALFAIVVGLPVLRLRGHYFAIATLGVSLAVAEIIANVDAFGGSTGLSLRQGLPISAYFYAMWLVCAASLVGTYLIARSKFGYALVAIRENEEAATVLGVNPTRYKVAAWAVSGVMAGSAGAVFAFANAFIDPATAFVVDNNVNPVVMALLGGVGTAAGPLFGGLILTGINETLWNHFPKIHTLFFGVAIMVVVLFLPRGLLYLFELRGSVKGYLASLGEYRV